MQMLRRIETNNGKQALLRGRHVLLREHKHCKVQTSKGRLNKYHFW